MITGFLKFLFTFWPAGRLTGPRVRPEASILVSITSLPNFSETVAEKAFIEEVRRMADSLGTGETFGARGQAP
jgi:hypothetical protein